MFIEESENVKNSSAALKMIIYQLKMDIISKLWGVQKVDVKGVKLWVTFNVNDEFSSR